MRAEVEELFHAVADLSADTRAQYFAEREIDGKTRNEVEALLAFDLPATLSLDDEIGRVANGTIDRLHPKQPDCGPYRLMDLIGSGGMGTVYSADRVDGEVTQQVAVKLLRPGADDPSLRRRFLAERQILASLSHPNIARLLDAGHREDGQPYLVMEYAEGKPIDEFASGLGVRQTVALFLKVCAAVGYLHRNLVVHRDLKPPNILVTDEGEPKLLDFGIAKLIDLTNDTTVTGVRMLTPDYASPEQVSGGQVTTATDIYSLGAVLYKLLTGSSPHHFENHSMEAIASTICAGKITPPSKLAPALKGDLEMILQKALRREPQERYVTIEQFSEDLENYLESRPIRARKGDAWYRARKFLRRYWLPAAAASLAIAGLSAGLAVANHERAVAQRRFEDVRQLANKLFDIDLEARKVSGNTKTRQMIVDTSLQYLRRLSADAAGDSELSLEVGNAYMRVARVQGVPISANLGQMDQAEQNLRIAERLIRSVLASQPENRTALLRLAQVLHDRMLLARMGDLEDDALALAKESAKWLEKYHAARGDKAEATSILTTYLNVADQYVLGQQLDDAIRLCARGEELAQMFDSLPYRGTFRWVSADAFRRQGDLERAAKDISESVRILDPQTENSEQGRTMNYVLALIKQGRILGDPDGISLGRSEQAAAVLERAFTIVDRYVHEDPNNQVTRGRLAAAGLGLAAILDNSDAPRALAVYDHILRHMSEIKDNSSARRFEVSALAGSTYPLRQLGRPAEAQQRLDLAFERLRQLKAYPAEKIKPSSEAAVTLRAMADLEASTGNAGKAIEIYESLLDRILASGSNSETNLMDATELSRIYAALTTLNRRAAHVDLASAWEVRRLQLWQRWDRKLPHNVFVSEQLGTVNPPSNEWLLSKR